MRFVLAELVTAILDRFVVNSNAQSSTVLMDNSNFKLDAGYCTKT